MAKRQRLNFRFHNPNTPEATAVYILPILVEANKAKIDRVFSEEMSKNKNQEKREESRCIV